jgi:hypothetical protein
VHPHVVDERSSKGAAQDGTGLGEVGGACRGGEGGGAWAGDVGSCVRV